MKLKHKISLLVIGILLVVSLLISSSYALWVFNVSQESTNVLVSDCFEITFADDNNSIGLSSSFPMKDSDGVKTTPYIFTIRNICNHPVGYKINLETLNTSTIDESYIQVDLNGRVTNYDDTTSIEPTLSNAKNAVMLYEDILEANGEKTSYLRLWINENAPSANIENKLYTSKISVSATVKKQYEVAMLTDGITFATSIRTLSGDIIESEDQPNTTIKHIIISSDAPSENTNTITLSAEESPNEIYAWFDTDTIYLYSIANKIYMNPNSTALFYRLEALEDLDLSIFDTSKVTNMSAMFCGMISLTSLDVSHFETSKVTNMDSMFADLSNITTLDLSNFDTSNVEDIQFLFTDSSKITNLDLSHFDTSKATNMQYMFFNCQALSELDLSSFDTSKVTEFQWMFGDCKSLEKIDISSFTSESAVITGAMFRETNALKELSFNEKFDVSNVENMGSMFYGMKSIKSLDISMFNTSKVTTMETMFYGMDSLEYLNLGENFDTSNVTDMSEMFAYDFSLKELDLGPKFYTSNVTDMYSMFDALYNIPTLDLSTFDTSKVTNMANMFHDLHSLTELDLSNFNTSSVTNMNEMFYGMINLKVLDLGNNFDTSNVTLADKMFEKNSKLETIYSNDFDLSKCPTNTYPFWQNSKLTGGQGTRYSDSHMGTDYARVDDPANSRPGYFTLKTN